MTACGQKPAAGLRIVLVLVTGLALARLDAAAPVEFRFTSPAAAPGVDPFARELWADVTTPSGSTLHLPAFYAGHDEFAVRARATERGEYRLGPIMETSGDGTPSAPVVKLESRRVRVEAVETLTPVVDAGGRPARLRFTGGRTYVPVGANLAWADSGGTAQFYQKALREFGRHGLTWMRIWMAHWDNLDLDWLPDRAPPAPGDLDLAVAENWDHIVAAAAANGVYLQVVLQHHGQFSTTADSNWGANPWNAVQAHGFLKNPEDFFTSGEARRLTKRKYRYIAARWGYSPAVLAWELFNEVHWTDAMRLRHGEADVARWHSEMAAYLRTVDAWHHLVTTSTENLDSPVYQAMDYFQPHNYPPDVLAGPRMFRRPPAGLEKPVFWGEMGDDHAALSPAQKAAGVGIGPQVWASLMGEGPYPGQPWLGWDLLRKGRMDELGAVAKVIAASGLGSREDWAPFSPNVDCPVRMPLVIGPGESWQPQSDPELSVPLDGTRPLPLARIPATYVGSAESKAEGYPSRVTLHVDYPHPAELKVRISGIDEKQPEAAARISVDGVEVARASWIPGGAGAPRADAPAVLAFAVAAGRHDLVLENPGAPGWFQVEDLDFGVDVPALAAIGRRGADAMVVWVWHRSGVFAVSPPAPVGGTLRLEEVPAGIWRVTWWDTLKGAAVRTTQVTHPGGQLELAVPPVSRQAAVVIVR